MSRSAEFGAGATVHGADGSIHSGLAAAGHAEPEKSPWYGVPGTGEGPDFEYEKRWSQSDWEFDD